jgi:hypothetical protein
MNNILRLYSDETIIDHDVEKRYESYLEIDTTEDYPRLKKYRGYKAQYPITVVPNTNIKKCALNTESVDDNKKIWMTRPADIIDKITFHSDVEYIKIDMNVFEMILPVVNNVVELGIICLHAVYTTMLLTSYNSMGEVTTADGIITMVFIQHAQEFVDGVIKGMYAAIKQKNTHDIFYKGGAVMTMEPGRRVKCGACGKTGVIVSNADGLCDDCANYLIAIITD